MIRIVDVIELSLMRLEGGMRWLIPAIWDWATDKEGRTQAQTIISASAEGKANPALGPKTKADAKKEAADRRLAVWLGLGAWLSLAIVASMVAQYRAGVPIGAQAGAHIACTVALIALKEWDATGPKIDTALIFATLIGNVAIAARADASSTFGTLALPALVAVAVAWRHGPAATVEEIAEEQRAQTQPEGGPTNGAHIVAGLRNSVPSIAALYDRIERDRAKGLRVPDPIGPIEIIRDSAGRLIVEDLLLPGTAKVSHVEAELDGFAAKLGGGGIPEEQVFVSKHDRIANRMDITNLPKPPEDMPPAPWVHATDPIPNPGMISVGATELGKPIWIPYRDENYLISGKKKSGKTTLARATCTALVQQPWVRLHIRNLKGNGDYVPFEGVAASVTAGSSDEDILEVLTFLDWMIAQAKERNRLMQDLTRKNLNTFPDQTFEDHHLEWLNNTPGALDGYDLDGIYFDKVLLEEANLATAHPVYGDAINERLTEIGEKYRSVGSTFALSLQRPSKQAIATTVKAQVGVRLCMAVESTSDRGLILDDFWTGPDPTQFVDEDTGEPIRGKAAVKGGSGKLALIPDATIAMVAPLLEAATATSPTFNLASAEPGSERPTLGLSTLRDVLASWPPTEQGPRRASTITKALADYRGEPEISARALAAALKAEIEARGGTPDHVEASLAAVAPAKYTDDEGTDYRGRDRGALVEVYGEDPYTPGGGVSVSDPSPDPSVSVPDPSTGQQGDGYWTPHKTRQTPLTESVSGSPDGSAPEHLESRPNLPQQQFEGSEATDPSHPSRMATESWAS